MLTEIHDLIFDGAKEILYMIVERYKNGDPQPIYKRFLEKGRLAPEGLEYISSWVDTSFKTCFQMMETNDEKLLIEWSNKWDDIVDFEIYPVMTSAEAAEKVFLKR